MNGKITKRLKSQRGIAMMVSLLALLLLAVIGMGLMFMADTENSVNNLPRLAKSVLCCARGSGRRAPASGQGCHAQRECLSAEYEFAVPDDLSEEPDQR